MHRHHDAERLQALEDHDDARAVRDLEVRARDPAYGPHRGERAEQAELEAERWQEAGYWLTPLVALIALLWFRRGWVVAT